MLYICTKSLYSILDKPNTFLREFFSEKKQVGAVAPSSKFLMKKMFKNIDFSKARNIIELGPGNGVFTKGLMDLVNEDCKVISIELNENFYQQVCNKVQHKNLKILHRSAEEIIDIAAENDMKTVDYIVSSLPLAVIPEESKQKILDGARTVLSENGRYIQFQYSLNAKKLLHDKFESVKIDFTPINIPPAFVYCCAK